MRCPQGSNSNTIRIQYKHNATYPCLRYFELEYNNMLTCSHSHSILSNVLAHDSVGEVSIIVKTWNKPAAASQPLPTARYCLGAMMCGSRVPYKPIITHTYIPILRFPTFVLKLLDKYYIYVFQFKCFQLHLHPHSIHILKIHFPFVTPVSMFRRYSPLPYLYNLIYWWAYKCHRIFIFTGIKQ